MVNFKKKWPLVSQKLKVKLQKCSMENDNSIHSNIINNTILVVDEITRKKIKRVRKLLLRCFMRKLYIDLILKDEMNSGLQGV